MTVVWVLLGMAWQLAWLVEQQQALFFPRFAPLIKLLDQSILHP